jgi:hypothetical protein
MERGHLLLSSTEPAKRVRDKNFQFHRIFFYLFSLEYPQRFSLQFALIVFNGGADEIF